MKSIVYIIVFTGKYSVNNFIILWNVKINWVCFQLSQIKSIICKIRKKYINNIFFLEEEIEEYIEHKSNKFISIIEFFYFKERK